MFGMGASGAAAASDTLAMLKVLEIASKPDAARAALEEILAVKEAADEARAAADAKERDLVKREAALRDSQTVWADKVDVVNSLERQANEKLAAAEAALTSAAARDADSVRVQEQVQARLANVLDEVAAAESKAKQAAAAEADAQKRLAAAERTAAEFERQADEAAQRVSALETQALLMEERVAAARAAAAKLLGD